MQNDIAPSVTLIGIICATIIVLALIVLSGYRCARQAAAKDSKTLDAIIKANRWYYLFIGSLIITIGIFAFSKSYHSNTQVINFLSLASSIVSIILAVVTIIYSFVTNSQTYGNVNELNSAADGLNAQAEEMGRISDSIKSATQALDDKIAQMGSSIKQVDSKAEAIMQSLSHRNESQASEMPSGNTINVNEFVSRYLNILSPMGHVALYACVLSKDHNKYFSFDVLGKEDNSSIYSWGIIVASDAAGIIDTTRLNDRAEIICNAYIGTIKKRLMKWIENEKKDNESVLLPVINQVEEFFNGK